MSSDHIVGYCAGANGAPCGRPLASARYYQQLGVWEHRGGGRCRSCTTKHQRRQQLLAVPSELPAASSVDLSWQKGAACAGQDSEPFTRELKTNKIPFDTKAAAWRFCAGCALKSRCGEEADKHLDIGLRGGSFRVLKPRLAAGDASRYKKYDLLAGEGPTSRPCRTEAAA